MNQQQDTPSTSGADVMVIRAWMEPAHEHGFRARLTFGTRQDTEPSVVFVSEPEQALEAVRGWLASLPQAPAADSEPVSE